MSIGLNQQSIDLSESDRVTWLANQIFKAFSETVGGLTFYILAVFITDENSQTEILTIRLGSTGTLRIGRVRLAWLWMGVGRIEWVMKRSFIIVSSRLVRNGFDLVAFG